jgi:hypothetical protein
MHAAILHFCISFILFELILINPTMSSLSFSSLLLSTLSMIALLYIHLLSILLWMSAGLHSISRQLYHPRTAAQKPVISYVGSHRRHPTFNLFSTTPNPTSQYWTPSTSSMPAGSPTIQDSTASKVSALPFPSRPVITEPSTSPSTLPLPSKLSYALPPRPTFTAVPPVTRYRSRSPIRRTKDVYVPARSPSPPPRRRYRSPSPRRRSPSPLPRRFSRRSYSRSLSPIRRGRSPSPVRRRYTRSPSRSLTRSASPRKQPSPIKADVPKTFFTHAFLKNQKRTEESARRETRLKRFEEQTAPASPSLESRLGNFQNQDVWVIP